MILTDQAWLNDPRTTAVMDALRAAGGPEAARFVGGCVRNAILGAPVDDVDIATPLRPEAVVAALTAAGLKAVPTGIAHGTVTAVSGKRGYEITTLRRDVETDGRRAVVAFTDDWAEDAARRDFRLNALYADAEGRVFDPTGEGLADAQAGRIVFVGDARTRIREDYLRILRFFRFHAWYGRGPLDAEGLAACMELADGLAGLSAERVSRELLKLLAAPDPTLTIGAMFDSGIMSRLLPDARRELIAKAVGLSDDPAVRLAALLPAEPSVVEATARRLRLSNTLRERLVSAAGEPLAPDMSDQEGRAAIYRLGRAAFCDRLRLAIARSGPARGAALLALAESWAAPSMPVGGRDLARLGVAPGPETGRILRDFEEGWIADDFPMEGHEARLRSLI